MKCDELKAGSPYCDRNNNMFLYHGDEEQDSELDDEDQVYMKGEVDAAIDELKEKLESVQATAYTESVDAGMRERKLKRALWLARAERAKEMCQRLLIQGYDPKWENIERKCRAKAEEYK